jgi:hypothetical protein
MKGSLISDQIDLMLADVQEKWNCLDEIALFVTKRNELSIKAVRNR